MENSFRTLPALENYDQYRKRSTMSAQDNRLTNLKPLYDPRRAIEHLQTLQGFYPIRFFAILFPLWEIETTATQEEGRPYELMEKYIERGIDEGQLHTVEELTHFFGLQREMVQKILNFLATLGHVTCMNAHWHLTPLGLKSVKEGMRYIAKEKRTKLYFDAKNTIIEKYASLLQMKPQNFFSVKRGDTVFIPLVMSSNGTPKHCRS